jgi:kumamolisin
MADTHTELADSRRPAPENCERLRDVDSNTLLDATITLKGPDLPTPNADTCALSREDIAKKFGVPEETVQKVTGVLQSYGLQQLEVTQGGRSLKVRGSAAAITKAFQSILGVYQAPGERPIRAREGVLKIPNELDGIVTGVFGLDQRRMATCHEDAAAHHGPKRHTPKKFTPKKLTPKKLEQRYNFPAGDGAGQTIAIAEFGEDLGNGLVAPAWIPSLVSSFCEKHRRAVPKIRLVNVGLSPSVCTMEQYNKYAALQPELAGVTGETMMDAQIVAALCPKADIGIYFATWGEGGWVNLLDAVTSGSGPVPVAVSISYGFPEQHAGWSCAAKTAINERLQIAALQGITVCVASGDDGSRGYLQGPLCHVQFPSSSPYVLSVGGTMLTTQEDGQVGEEVVWGGSPGRSIIDGGQATGGGVSRYPRAPWQTVPIPSLNPGAPEGRVVPDVSALAGPPYYDVLPVGVFGGGTSAATPLWASLIARIDAALPAPKRQRFLPPLLYKLYQPDVGAAGFRDIVSGDNASQPDPGIGYHAKKGFDAVTGLGVPDGRRLLDALETA